MAAPFLAALFQWLRCFYGFAVSRFAVSMASPFLGLAYAELKVNFVEGFAVLWVRRFKVSRFLSF